MSLPTHNLRSPAPLLRFGLTTLLGLLLDQWTKVVAFEKLQEWPNGYPFIPGWIHFQAMMNRGAVFGIGQGQRGLFVIVSIGAIFFIGYLFLSSGRRSMLYQVLLGMLLAGVLGNMYDRVVFGFVRDMIYVFPGKRIFGHEIFPWIFNMADSLLCTGVALMIAYSLFLGQDETRAMKDQSDKPGFDVASRPKA